MTFLICIFNDHKHLIFNLLYHYFFIYFDKESPRNSSPTQALRFLIEMVVSLYYYFMSQPPEMFLILH